ncbi:MAG: hypothetical protein IPP29_18180 [Bacteroidetes bacterium]|nr:hypothetical protein [Bacteroidota bacterium]
MPVTNSILIGFNNGFNEFKVDDRIRFKIEYEERSNFPSTTTAPQVQEDVSLAATISNRMVFTGMHNDHSQFLT